MKEFKFWAVPFSMKSILLFAVPVWIIFIPILLSEVMFQYFIYFFIGSGIWSICCLIFFVKRVKIVFSPTHTIHIFINGREEYIGDITKLEYVQGANIGDSKSSASLYFAFSDKTFTFTVGQNNGLLASNANPQVEMLRYMVVIYDLQKEAADNSFFSKTYIYRNMKYDGVSITKGYNKSER